MSGVALVGYSGSLIKDAIKESLVNNLARALGLREEPEVTKVPCGHILHPICPDLVSLRIYPSHPSSPHPSAATQFVVEGYVLLHPKNTTHSHLHRKDNESVPTHPNKINTNSPQVNTPSHPSSPSGSRGSLGTLSILLIMPILSIPSVTRLSSFFDLPRGWTQMVTTPTVLYSGLVICCSISLFQLLWT